MPAQPDGPDIRDVGLTGLLVRFSDRLSEAANRAALAFRAEVEAAGWDGVAETATSLTSVFVRYDPLTTERNVLHTRLQALIDSRDWTAAALPAGRRHLRIPLVIGGDDGPQLKDAAKAAGLDTDTASQQIAQARLRVMTLGFAPGQPYMGELADHWNIPRLNELNKQVPGGSLVLAIRQLIIFTRPAPTGWHHVGQTAFECYRPKAEHPFALAPGDEVSFREVSPDELERIRATDDTGAGGAEVEDIA